MSRSGYTEDVDDQWQHIRWRGAVASAIRGKRGQALLIALRDALDAMPEKVLAANSFQSAEGEFCTLGVLGSQRGIEMGEFIEFEDAYGLEVDHAAVAQAFGVSEALVQEIMYENDEAAVWDGGPNAGAKRWSYMRRWLDKKIMSGDTAGGGE